MKKILAPTDYSDAAQNAVDYAAQLAIKAKAKLILFNAYHMPPLALDVPVVDISMEEIQMQSMSDLKTIRELLLEKYGSALNIECENRSGFAVDAINDFAIENDVDIIVMGMQGSSLISEKVVGSITTALMQNPPCPILVIDQHVKFAEIGKIVLACDYLKMPSYAGLDRLKEFAELFDAPWIDVLHVVEKPSVEQTILENISTPKIHQLLRDIPHSVHSLDNEDIIDGINNYVSENNADMVAMIPRRHSIWRNIFYSPVTKRMAFHTNVPLLIIQ